MEDALRQQLTSLGFSIKPGIRKGQPVELVSGATVDGMRMHVVDGKWNLILKDGKTLILPEGVEMEELTGVFEVKGGVGIVL